MAATRKALNGLDRIINYNAGDGAAYDKAAAKFFGEFARGNGGGG